VIYGKLKVKICFGFNSLNKFSLNYRIIINGSKEEKLTWLLIVWNDNVLQRILLKVQP